MKNKLMKCFLLLILFIICIGTVSATEQINEDSMDSLNISDSNQDLSNGLVSNDMNADVSDSLDQSLASSDDSEDIDSIHQSSNSNVLTANMVGEGEKTWYVDANNEESGDGSEANPFNNLKLAIENAGDNDTIKVNNGIYNGSNNAGFKINQSGLSIVANGDDVVFVANNKVLFNFTGNNLTLNGLTFVNGSDTSKSFLVYGNGTTIENCHFINTSAVKIFGNNTTMNNTTFYSGRTGSSTSTVSWNGHDGVLNNTHFDHTQGTAITWSGHRATIVNSNFTYCGNQTPFDCGAIDLSSPNSTIDNCLFDHNRADESSGAIRIGSTNNNITNCNFTNNNACAAGAIYLVSGSNNIENCSFINNTARRYGGGAISSLTKNNISNSDFINNTAYTYGGALSVAYLNLDNCTFVNNTAPYGSAIYTLLGNVSNSTFEGNNAYFEDLENVTILAINQLNLENNKGLDQISEKTYEIGEDVNSTTSVSFNSYLSMGYRSYCIESHQHSPSKGVIVNVTNETAPHLGLFINSINGEYIYEYIKILVFLAETSGNKTSQQQNIWTFTDGNFRSSGMYSNGTYKNNTIGKVLELYDSGFRVNDTQETYDDNGNKYLFDFKASISYIPTQNLLLYRVINETVDKKTLNDTLIRGDIVEYVITVTNNGTNTLYNVSVVDLYSSEELEYVGYVNGSHKWKFNETESRWDLVGSLARNKTANFTIYFKTLVNGTITNKVSCAYDNIFINNDTENITVLDYDLAVEKNSLDPVVYVGNQTRFEIIVHNTGQVNQTNVNVVEDDYEGLVYDSFIGDDWTHFVNDDGKHQFNYTKTLGVDESASFIIVFNAPVPGNFTNIVIASSDKNVTNASNNTTVYNSSLKVEKVALDTEVKIGDKTSFMILVSNDGDCDLTEVFVKESKYDGLVYDSFTDESGKWKFDGKDKWSYDGVLAIGESANFTVIFNATKRGNLTNRVVAGSNITNDTGSNDTVVVLEGILEAQKIALNGTVPLGEKTQFRIVVTNTGDIPLEGVFVEETKYDGLKYDSFIDESGKWSFDGKNRWTFSDILDVGESAEFIVVFKTLREGNFTNIITVGSNDTNVNETTANDTVTVFKNETADNSTDDFEKDVVKKNAEKTIVSSKGIQAGNPIMVLILSLFALFIPLFRRK